jgi:hypothetical protein
VWWITLLVAAVVLVFGRLARAFDRGDQIGVVAAASFTVISWWLVQQWGLNNLYELVPAFFLAGFAALAVSSITRSTGGGSE